jgi:Tol biopolymer transport system component/DNA-binding winged helix-turn-helix (wHTH) protein
MALRHEELRKIYRFDEFQVDVRKRVLLRAGKLIALNSRAFDLLLALVTSDGRELSKEQLMQMVWQDQIVEENNLAVHIYNLRKILGKRKDEPRYIITIPGVGYRFVADVFETTSAAEELFIESHTLSRIVVEEESESSTRIEGGKPPSALAAFNNGEVVARTEASSTNEIEAAQSTAVAAPLQALGRKWLVPGALLVGLLLTAALGGFWLSRNRSQFSGNSSGPRQAMSISRLTDGRPLGAASISPDGKFIAYIENTSYGAGTLYVQQTETNTVLQLLEPAERTFGCVNFSPDSLLIYFVAFDKRDPNAALYSVPVLGGTPKRIVSNMGACFTLSPDGRRVAFYRHHPETKQQSLMIAALDGSAEQARLTYVSHEFNTSFGLTWSPDGNVIAVNADTEPDDSVEKVTIFGIDVNSGAIKSLTSEQFSSMGKTCWTTDGRNLVFVAKRPRGENKLYLMDYPSGAVRQITNDLESYGNYGLGITADSSALVSGIFERKIEIWRVDANGKTSKAVRVTNGATDGRFGITALHNGQIAYISRTGNSLEIRTAKEESPETRVLTTDSFTQKDVAASPDGRYLVFASDQAGESHIFRMNAEDGSEITQLTFGTNSDSQPVVSPDGQWVGYTSYSGKQHTVWKVPLLGGPAVQITDYESGSPSFAPDGQSIACVLPSVSPAKFASIAIVPAKGGKPVKAFQVMPFDFSFQTIHWTPDGKAIVFVKGENGIFNLWQQPLAGGAPQPLTNFASGAIWNFAYSHDGKRIFVSRGSSYVDIVLIKNFR